MNYIKCIQNQVYLEGHEGETYGDLTVGAVYKALPYNPETDGPRQPDNKRPYMVRVRGEFSNEPGGEDGYLYPVDYFEPFTPNLDSNAIATVTVHLPADLKQVLHAEALDSGRPVSQLVRAWMEAQLDLPAHGQPA